MKKILLVMAVTVALSLNACTFTDQSETRDRKSTRLKSSHANESRMPSSA